MKQAACLILGAAIGVAAPTASSQVMQRSAGDQLLALSSASVQGRNGISGHVFNTSRRPVEQLNIELLDEFDSVIATTRTSSSGLYIFNDLRGGSYQVRVLTHGTPYDAQTERITMSGLGSQIIQMDFTLKEKRSSAAAATSSPGTVYVQEVPEAARKAYERGLKNLADDKKGEAGLADLKAAIDLFPQYYMALERLGTEYFNRQQYNAARLVLIRAIEVNSRGYGSLYALGLAQFHLKQTKAAVESLRRAVELNSNSLNVQLWFGIVLRQDAQFEQAESHLKRAKVLANGRVPDVHWHLALLYHKLNRFSEAAQELELFLKGQPDARDAELVKKLIKQMKEKAKSG